MTENHPSVSSPLICKFCVPRLHCTYQHSGWAYTVHLKTGIVMGSLFISRVERKVERKTIVTQTYF